MTATAIFEPVAVSPRTTARAAGAFWLLTFILGAVALFVVRSAGNPQDMVANESLYRLGIAANLVATVCYIGAVLYIYYVLEPVSRRVSLLAALFGLTGCMLGAVVSALQLAPLVIVRGGKLIAFTPEQLQGLARVFLRLADQASYVSFVFFGLHCLLVGLLIARSSFLPRFVGLLMVLAGLGWLTHAFAQLLVPALGRSLLPYILLPGMVGEATLTLWLLIAGVNVSRWREQQASH